MEKNYNTSLSIRIDWSDLDLFGHVNNVAFFRYIQAARVSFCRQAGLTSLNEPGMPGFVVASSQCQFRKPLYFPGDVIVSARVEWMKNSSMQLEYLMRSSGETIAEGQDILVVFDYANKKVISIPSEVREAICAIEKRQV